MTPDIGFVTQDDLDLDEQLAVAGDADFDYVEILLDGSFHPATVSSRRRDLRDRLDEHDLDVLVHLPFPTSLGSPHEALREGAIEAHRKWIDVAVGLGAEKGVVHPESLAFDAVWDDEELRPHVDESIRTIAAYGRERGFEVCPENLFEKPYTIETIDGLLGATDVSMTLDTGHARIAGYDSEEIAAFVSERADRIGHVHLNDNRRELDEHLPIGAGTIDFETILDAFPDDWDGTLSIEVDTTSYGYLRQSKAELDRMR